MNEKLTNESGLPMESVEQPAGTGQDHVDYAPNPNSVRVFRTPNGFLYERYLTAEQNQLLRDAENKLNKSEK